MIKRTLQTFFKSEIAIGVSLLVATAFALLTANSENYPAYKEFLEISVPINLGFIGIFKDLTLLEWINDGLMAIFFLLVGLELKREVLIGELSSRQRISLPAIAAAGGVAIPLLIFVFFNRNNAENLHGFAVPCATDIAFAYGMISFFGKRISNSLKVFLVALAVLDDLVAIFIIAFFYSESIDSAYLFYMMLTLAALATLNHFRVGKISLYLLLGGVLWLMVLKSGLHATLAGVILAMFIPVKVKDKPLLLKLAHQIAPMVNFMILPIFAFANAGVRIEVFSTELFLDPLVLGVTAGLFLGKQVGVMSFSYLAIKFGFSRLPKGANWMEFYATAIFTGIGFTMSLFVGSLAFLGNDSVLNLVKIGVLLGSLLSVFYGSFIIYVATLQKK